MDAVLGTPVLWAVGVILWLGLLWLGYRAFVGGYDLFKKGVSRKPEREVFARYTFRRSLVLLVLVVVAVWWTVVGVEVFRPRNEPPVNQAEEQRLKSLDIGPTKDLIPATPTMTLEERFNERQQNFKDDSQEQKDKLAGTG